MKLNAVLVLSLAAIGGLGAMFLGMHLFRGAAEAGSTYTVDIMNDDPTASACSNDPADCSLRGAIIHSNGLAGLHTVLVPAGTYVLTEGEIDITDDLVLEGAQGGGTIVDGGNNDRVFDIDVAGSVAISHVVIQNGTLINGYGAAIRVIQDTNLTISDSTLKDSSAQNNGGALNAEDGSTVNITNSTISGNSAQSNGGGIAAEDSATVTITESTVSGNMASSNGGGLNVQNEAVANIVRTTFSGNTAASIGGAVNSQNSASVFVVNSTLSGNTASNGGGIHAQDQGDADLSFVTVTANAGGGLRNTGSGQITLDNTIVAANPGGNCQGDGVVSQGHNLEDGNSCNLNSGTDLTAADPALGPLTDNGGPTQTHALLEGSDAIDAASGAGCPATDQRKEGRPKGNACDIGAFESAFSGATATPTPTAFDSPTPEATESPTPTPATPSATATASPTDSTTSPTPTPAGEMLVWGDHNCSGSADPVDSLLTLRYDAGLTTSTGTCPEMGQVVDVVAASLHQWGDVDCEGAVTPVDSLKLLRYDAGLNVSAASGCPTLGDMVTVLVPTPAPTPSQSDGLTSQHLPGNP